MTAVKKKKATPRKNSFVGYLSEKQKERFRDLLQPSATLEEMNEAIRKIHRQVERNHRRDEAYDRLFLALLTAQEVTLNADLYTPFLQSVLSYWLGTAYFAYLYLLDIITDDDLLLHLGQQNQGTPPFDSTPHDA